MHRRAAAFWVMASLFLASSVTAATLGVNYRRAEAKNAALAKAIKAAENRGIQKGIELTRRTPDPFSETPFFVFDSPQIPWETLAPNLGFAYGEAVVKQVVGTFPAVGDLAGSDNREVKVDAAGLLFPRPGRYYLFTSLGCFKVLILDKGASDDDKILAIASFVARNCAHNMADARLIQPNTDYYPYHRPDMLLKKFFASDQPLLIKCGYSAEFLNYVLSKRGYRVQRLQLQTEDRPSLGHIIAQVFFPVARKWGAIDPDWGAVVKDAQGQILSISEIAKMSREAPEGILPVDIADKKSLLDNYELMPYCPTFSWSPDKMADKPRVSVPAYRSMITKYTHEYWTYDYDPLFQWVNCRMYSWDGQELTGKSGK